MGPAADSVPNTSGNPPSLPTILLECWWGSSVEEWEDVHSWAWTASHPALASSASLTNPVKVDKLTTECELE